METSPAEFEATMAASEATARQAQELINFNGEVLNHVSHVGNLALRTEVMLDDPEANLTNLEAQAHREAQAEIEAQAKLEAQAEIDGTRLLERAGEGMTHLYESLLDAGDKFPWADHYSKNYWYQFSDPDRYKGPTKPSNELWHQQPTNREELEENHHYMGLAHRYQRHINEHEHSFPYLDIEAETRDFGQPDDQADKQPVLDYLKSRNIEYTATWQLTNQQRTTTSLGVQADVLHEFTDRNSGLTVKIAYGDFRSEALRDADHTPEVVISDKICEKHLGEESWDQIEGVGLLLSILEPGKEFNIDVPAQASDRVAGEWRDALGGMQKDMEEFIDQPLSTADFRKAQDKLLHHLNRSNPNVGWKPSDKVFHVAMAHNPKELEIWRAHYGLRPAQERDEDEENEDEFVRRLRLVDND